MNFAPSSINSSTVPFFSIKLTVWRIRISRSSSSRTSWIRLISYRSRPLRSPIFTPCSFSSSGSSIRREKIFTSMIVPVMPGGTLRDESLTSLAFSPKIAVSSFSSGESSVSPFGVIFPARISPAVTLAPSRMIPRSSRSSRFSSATFGISRVISSIPRFVSLTCSSSSWIWIDVKTSSLTNFSLITIASSKFDPYQGMNATRTFRPSASSPESVLGPSAMISPGLTFSPTCTRGR